MRLDISQLAEIRIVVNKGGGFGHKKAAITAMLRLREMGFTGVFDIRYRDLYSHSDWTEAKRKEKGVGYVGDKLAILIPGFIPTPINEDDLGQELETNNLGRLRITRLPDVLRAELKNYLPQTLLTVTAADDLHTPIPGEPPEQINYNTIYYFGLQPTDWGEPRFVSFHNSKFRLNEQARLSSQISYDRRPTALTEKEFKLKDFMERTKEVLLSQLVYPYYHSFREEFDVRRGTYTGFRRLSLQALLFRLLEAHRALLKENSDKASLLIFPRILDRVFGNTALYIHLYEKENPISVIFINSIAEFPQTPKKYCIYILNIGPLNLQLFDEVMLDLTSLPPVLEGCNSIETCEKAGRLYLHCSKTFVKINRYAEDTHHKECKLHLEACAPLEEPENSDIEPLVCFMRAAQAGGLESYRLARKGAHLMWPDILESAFSILAKHVRPEEWNEQVRAFNARLQRGSEALATTTATTSTAECSGGPRLFMGRGKDVATTRGRSIFLSKLNLKVSVPLAILLISILVVYYKHLKQGQLPSGSFTPSL